MLSSSYLPSSSTLLHFDQSKSFAGTQFSPPGSIRLRLPSAVSMASPETASSSSSSFYEVLGISTGATVDEIKAAYRRIAMSCHPDVDSAGADEFMKANAAYSTLSDPDKRADYDRRVTRIIRSPLTMNKFGRLSASPVSSSYYRFPRRNWETDQCW